MLIFIFLRIIYDKQHTTGHCIGHLGYMFETECDYKTLTISIKVQKYFFLTKFYSARMH